MLVERGQTAERGNQSRRSDQRDRGLGGEGAGLGLVTHGHIFFSCSFRSFITFKNFRLHDTSKHGSVFRIDFIR